MSCVRTYKIEDGKLCFYETDITYDESGNEVSRTEPKRTMSIAWHDGRPFTIEEFAERMKSKEKDPSLQELF